MIHCCTHSVLMSCLSFINNKTEFKDENKICNSTHLKLTTSVWGSCVNTMSYPDVYWRMKNETAPPVCKGETTTANCGGLTIPAYSNTVWGSLRVTGKAQTLLHETEGIATWRQTMSIPQNQKRKLFEIILNELRAEKKHSSTKAINILL